MKIETGMKENNQTSGSSEKDFMPFLKMVANDLTSKKGNDLSSVAMIFPNKRASLFFNDYLVKGAAPIWSPRYVTISELFAKMSELAMADPIYTVCKMYQIYVEQTRSDETLDFFYGWGEKLLADFDDADKNMVDTRRLFKNLSEIKALESNDYINAEQEKALKEFFNYFSVSENSAIKTKFLSLWNKMNPIYEELCEQLSSEGLAYEGHLYRKVVEDLENGKIE